MPSKKSVPRTCELCGTAFLVRPVDDRRGVNRFCSRSCSSKATRTPPVMRGAENPSWKGGGTKSGNGYWYLLQPSHHRAHKSGYVKRATVVLEKTLGRFLEPDEVAHHKDKNKENDSPDNLACMTIVAHNQHHAGERPRRAEVRQPSHPNNRRYIWPSDVALVEMWSKMSLREIAAVIGCSHKSVERRLKQRGLY